MAYLAIWGAFAIGVGLERGWPASEYGGASYWVWLVGGLTAFVVATIWKWTEGEA